MSDLDLSIIVPSYNVEPFILRCLESLNAGETSASVEVIVVDDASVDGTFQAAKAWNGCSNYRVIRNDANSGLGASRNVGLEAARGRYVWFVDGDDFLSSGAVSSVVQMLRNRSPDVLVVNFSCADEAGRKIDWIECPWSGDHDVVLTGPAFFSKYFSTTYAWAFVIKRELLSRNQLRFQPRINMQDAELLPRVMSFAAVVLISGIQACIYVKRVGSYINSQDAVIRDRYFASVLEVYSRLLEFRNCVDAPLMRVGLDAKIAAIRRIVLLAFVYDSLDVKARVARLHQIRAHGLFPFEPIPGSTKNQVLVRYATNLFPCAFPAVFALGRRHFRRFQTGFGARR